MAATFSLAEITAPVPVTETQGPVTGTTVGPDVPPSSPPLTFQVVPRVPLASPINVAMPSPTSQGSPLSSPLAPDFSGLATGGGELGADGSGTTPLLAQLALEVERRERKKRKKMEAKLRKRQAM